MGAKRENHRNITWENTVVKLKIILTIVIAIIIAAIVTIICLFLPFKQRSRSTMWKKTINNATMTWQPRKAETKHKLPEGIIKAQHDVQVVFVLKFRAESMGGPFQSIMSYTFLLPSII